MDHFEYRDGELYAEDVPVARIAAEVGTPAYIYSRATLERHWHAFDNAFGDYPHLVCYAVKANSNLAVLNLFARLGSGFDIVSGGELERILRAGGDPARVVFSGVGKSADEIRHALEVGIHCFNVESEPELQRISDIATDMGKTAPIALRVNPDVDPKTHPYIATGLATSKFGIDIERAPRVYARAAQLPGINIVGVDCHIGSQLTEVAPFLDALDRVLALIKTLQDQGIELKHLDLGGGLGIRYGDEEPPHPKEQAAAITERLQQSGIALPVHIEPGRAIAGNAGILVTRVEYLKRAPEKNFAIIDAAMNDLMRPALYQAWHNIEPVKPRQSSQQDDNEAWEIVGPVCETGDVLGSDRPLALQQGDLLAIKSAGAYGFTMSSNYNSRPRAAEIMVDGPDFYVIRQRETMDDLLNRENILPDGVK